MSPKQREVLDLLAFGALTISELKARAGHGTTQALNALIAQGRVREQGGVYRRVR